MYLSYLLFSLSERYIVTRPYWKQQLLTGSGMNFNVNSPGLWEAWLKRKQARNGKKRSRIQAGVWTPAGYLHIKPTSYGCPGTSHLDQC